MRLAELIQKPDEEEFLVLTLILLTVTLTIFGLGISYCYFVYPLKESCYTTTPQMYTLAGLFLVALSYYSTPYLESFSLCLKGRGLRNIGSCVSRTLGEVKADLETGINELIEDLGMDISINQGVRDSPDSYSWKDR